MLSTLYSGTTIGLQGVLVSVEVDVAERGFPTFTIVGLPSKTIEESKERVRTSIKNSSFQMPETRIVVNLAPADLPKKGAIFDLPIALGILVSSKLVEKKEIKKSIFLGELSLDGSIHAVPGVLPIVLCAKQHGITNIFIPQENSTEALLVSGVSIYPISSLGELILHLNREIVLEPSQKKEIPIRKEHTLDFSFIKGQHKAKRACEIAAAGFHNLHMVGPPGAGKTLLARSLPGILPFMEEDEMIEVAKIYSVYQKETRISYLRPFRSPHNTISRVGLIGGGSNLSPGEISLAHRGVLFLDEIPEFPRSVLESLRQPLEDGEVTISRAYGSLKYPTRFMLISSANPCPCGFLGHPKKQCTCSYGQIAKYKKRLSGPLLDRIDFHITVSPVEDKYFYSTQNAETNAHIRERVCMAWEIQKKRFEGQGIKFNGEMSSQDINTYVRIERDAQFLLSQAASHLVLSARSYFKTIKIAQTIADLSKKQTVDASSVAEALQYRFHE